MLKNMINKYNPRINPYLEFVYKKNYGVVDSYLFEQDDVLTGNPSQGDFQQSGSNAQPQKIPKFDAGKILGSFTSGFKKSYDASSVFSPEEIQMYEGMKSKIDPYVKKAIDFCNNPTMQFLLKYLKISLPLGVAVTAAALVGGSVPMVTVVYFVQKYFASATAWLIGLKHHKEEKHESFSFSDYYHRRLLEEGIYDDITAGAGMVGGALGNVAGNVYKYGNLARKNLVSMGSSALSAASSIGSSAKKLFSDIWSSMKSNPYSTTVTAMKISIVVAVAVASGGAAATAYKMLTSPEGLSTISGIVATMGVASAEEATKTLADVGHQMAAGHAIDAAGHSIDAAAGHAAHAAHAAGHAGHAAHAAGHAGHAAHAAGHAGHAAHAAHAAGHAAHAAGHAAHGHGLAHDLLHMGTHGASDAAAHVTDASKKNHPELAKLAKTIHGFTLGGT
jgi:hypothetical protein